MSRVLVTGHLGYVGSVLTPVLQQAGHAVIGLDSDLYRDCAVTELPNTPAFQKDIRDVEARDFDMIDAVVHLAALSNDPLGYLDPELTTELNHVAAVRVAEAARAAGVRRFVFVSTCSVYGQADRSLIDETYPPAPLTPYAESKWRAEQDILRLSDSGFEVVVLRPGTAYGWSPKLRFDLVVNNLVAWAKATGMIRLKGDGQAWRPIVHVADISGIIAAVLTAPAKDVSTRIFNLGYRSGNYRTADLAAMIAGVLPGARVIFADKPLHDARSYRVDCRRLAAALPAYPWAWILRDGIADLSDRIDRLDLGVDEFEGAAFGRSAHILALQQQGLIDDQFRWVEKPSRMAKRVSAGRVRPRAS